MCLIILASDFSHVMYRAFSETFVFTNPVIQKLPFSSIQKIFCITYIIYDYGYGLEYFVRTVVLHTWQGHRQITFWLQTFWLNTLSHMTSSNNWCVFWKKIFTVLLTLLIYLFLSRLMTLYLKCSENERWKILMRI